MTRSTWITLAVFALLLGLWFVQSRPRTVDTPAPLSIDGYIGNVGIEEARTLGQKQPPPYTRITVTRADAQGGKEVIELTKDDAPVPPPTAGDKTPPPDAKWLAKRTVGGKTTTWKAQGFRATTMAEQLQRSIRSNFAVRIGSKLAEEYGLDAQHALDVTLAGDDKPAVKLRVGLLQKAEKDGEATTWLADPTRPDVAYQVAGRDLRTAFDVSWNELRDRQLLTLDPASVDRLELRRPGQTPERIVVTRPPLTADKAQQAAREWTIAEPPGVPAGDIEEWLKAIERLSAAEFVAAGDPALANSGLEEATAATLTITNTSRTTTLTFGNEDPKRPNKETWLRVVGRDEAYRISSFQRDQVLLTLAQLRDRHLLAGKSAKDLQSFVVTGPTGRFSATRSGDGWNTTVTNSAVDVQKITAFIDAAAALKVDFVMDLSEATAHEGPKWTIQLTFSNGVQRVTLFDGVNDNVYGQLLGRDGEPQFFKLPARTAKQLQKQPADFIVHDETSAPTKIRAPATTNGAAP